MSKSLNKIKVVELFAGVGGFRCALEQSSGLFDTIWANQWEPGKKMQHAYNCYIQHFGLSHNHVNENISIVKSAVPNHDLLVGGFPCQDYSVAQSCAKGIEGKKGVLWWDIRDIIDAKRPSYILLENVDRLIKSPSSQRGRDFGIILRCLYDLDYAVEWRVINAAEYGCAQRRRRVFIFAYKNTTSLHKRLVKRYSGKYELAMSEWLRKEGFYAKSFPVQKTENPKKRTYTNIGKAYYENLQNISSSFAVPLFNSGIMCDGYLFSEELAPVEETPITLREIRHTEKIDPSFFLNGNFEKWEFLKGAKKINRIRPNGEPYIFAEGGMCFPDNLDKPARTILTSESSTNRSSHVIEDAQTGRYRLLTQVECERVNGFPDNWTNTGMPAKFRYFTMGNALVVPIIKRIGDRILELYQEEGL